MIKVWSEKGEIHIHMDEALNAKSQIPFLKAIEAQPQGEPMMFHMEKMPYIDSSGLASLLQLRDHAQGFQNVILCDPSDSVFHTLKIANFHRLYPIRHASHTAETDIHAPIKEMRGGRVMA
ncbi:STAS domain-containing protein [Magnetococcus sp. PR-3]|uniref:STAS domain-containing protein n=1 Tax=Magnetococcus sp. PR-3 TaxID=3120355 RepID=UPI002FCE049C